MTSYIAADSTVRSHLQRLSAPLTHFAGGLARIAVELEMMATRNRSRRALRELPDDLLKDVGLSRADIEREMSKPFWR